MLLVKTKLDKSEISGIGLFADEFIKEGTVVWEYNPKFDLLYSKEEIEHLPVAFQEQLHKYSYLDKDYGKYLLCGDDARFFNHSDDPNCLDSVSDEDVTIAARDIQKGEELTCNYRVFYSNLNDHPEIKLMAKL
ncbi:MAG: SET domain-containing protein [Candidatus Pacebacteria bacterium]|jgi:SET domain-containing protein|nr:SET domain-containing protein [Candidatus Paceibacterota bacterium]